MSQTIPIAPTPQLRIALTPHCNLSCIYCRPGGEGYYDHIDVRLSTEEIAKIILECARVGFTHIKLTGGEPLLRNDLTAIIIAAKQTHGIQEIQMVTNGTLLRGRVKELKTAGLDWITISLDAADPGIFWDIRKVSLSIIAEAINECTKSDLPVRINMVVMKSNFDQVEPMIKFASDLGCTLKLLDLFYLDTAESFSFWTREFLDFGRVREKLLALSAKYIGLEEAPGGIGAPLSEYTMPNGLQVVVKDSTQGTYYHASCKDCRNYPCQDALISVRVTHDGCLKRCLVRNDNLVPLLPLLRHDRMEEIHHAIGEVFRLMTESSYHPYTWKPDFLLKRESEKGTGA